MAHLFGPYEGRRHDASMLRASGLLDKLQDNMIRPDGGVYCLYGDAGYPLLPHVLSPFRGNALSAEEQVFNRQMSEARVSVEWGFGGVYAKFGFLLMKSQMRLGLQPIGQYYIVATLLYNCYACMYGNEISKFFDLESPTLEEYLQ